MNDAAVSVGELSAARMLRGHLLEARYDVIRALRTPGFVVPVLLFPCLIYLFMGILAGRALMSPAAANVLFVNFIVFATMGPGLAAFGTHLAMDRGSGVLQFRRALPIPPLAFVTSKLLAALLFSLIAIAAVNVLAWMFGDLTLSLGEALAVTATSALAVAPFCAIGLAVSACLPWGAVMPVVNVLYVGMALTGGLFLRLPADLAWVTYFSPPFYLAQLNAALIGQPTSISPLLACAALTGVTLAAGWVALFRIRSSGA